jgi:excisionase family DNA binding protein
MRERSQSNCRSHQCETRAEAGERLLTGWADPGCAVAGQVPLLALRLKEAAAAIGVSDRTLWTWTAEGEVPHVRISGTVIYPLDTLREWLSRRSSKVTSAAEEAESLPH